MNEPPDLANWDDRLTTFAQAMAAHGYVPFGLAQYFSGIICVARLCLSRPEVVHALRNGMEQFLTMEHQGIKEYMQKTIRLFETDVLLGSIVIETILGKSNNQEGE